MTGPAPVAPARPRTDGDVLREIPMPPYVTVEDVQFAVRAVVVHAPRVWSGGTICRNDASPHPCRLHVWGRRVLTLRGLPSAEIDALVERGDPTAGPRPYRPGA
ncbi:MULTISPECIES: hypothetical protein [unclassified Micromonospora]|uniref:hypothetical protein n=1 Tax=unclassified Micromonospora TaxID=2617518 RepID=UPI001C22A809|nr:MULTISPECIES: hypothetical protein [unclassified Micromonospora]MBU8859136.1 hypothetical protein [Micromonospora sp. WMMB482]MDM4778645.1 hypothetical protein [Micromonospora sp. b486]